jgi:hypothetical protein
MTIDETGNMYGYLTVIEQSDIKPRSTSRSKATWVCECTCGVTFLVEGHALRSRHVTSCGRTKYHNDAHDQRDALIDWVFESNAWAEGDECITDWPGFYVSGRPQVRTGTGPSSASISTARVFLAMAEGIAPPEGMEAAHFYCHNHQCVRLDHLRWETPRNNASSTPTFRQLLKIADPTEIQVLIAMAQRLQIHE